MTTKFCIYVPKPSLGNLNLALANGTYGWRDSALARGDHQTTVNKITPGSTGVFGYHGPGSRVESGGWKGKRLAQFYIVRFTGVAFRSEVPLWADGLFPNRVTFELVEAVEDARSVCLPDDILEALRLSANTGGVPHLVQDLGLTIDYFGDEIHDAVDQDLDDHTLGIDGDLDEMVRTLARREQRKIRLKKFGQLTKITCDICSRTLPRRMIIAAHIKRRRDADPVERRDLRNIMANCPQCDHLFELGHIAVGPDGRLHVEQRPATSDLKSLLRAFDGATCRAHHAQSDKYFDWHRINRFRC